MECPQPDDENYNFIPELQALYYELFNEIPENNTDPVTVQSATQMTNTNADASKKRSRDQPSEKCQSKFESSPKALRSSSSTNSVHSSPEPSICITPDRRTPGLSPYHRMTVTELRRLACRRGIPYSNKRKAYLIYKLEKENIDPGKFCSSEH